MTDDRAALREQLEAATGERIATLEAIKPERAKGREAGLDEGRSAGPEAGSSASRESEPTLDPEITDRGLGL